MRVDQKTDMEMCGQPFKDLKNRADQQAFVDALSRLFAHVSTQVPADAEPVRGLSEAFVSVLKKQDKQDLSQIVQFMQAEKMVIEQMMFGGHINESIARKNQQERLAAIRTFIPGPAARNQYIDMNATNKKKFAEIISKLPDDMRQQVLAQQNLASLNALHVDSKKYALNPKLIEEARASVRATVSSKQEMENEPPRHRR